MRERKEREREIKKRRRMRKKRASNLVQCLFAVYYCVDPMIATATVELRSCFLVLLPPSSVSRNMSRDVCRGYIQKKTSAVDSAHRNFQYILCSWSKKKLKSLLLLLLPLLIKRTGVAGKLNLVSVSKVLSDVWCRSSEWKFCRGWGLGFDISCWSY